MAEAMVTCFEIDLYCEHESRYSAWPPREGKIFLTKWPADIMHAEAVLRRVKDYYFVYLLRDPRDVVVSRHGRAPDSYWMGLRRWKIRTPIGDRLRDHPRFVTVKYEDLVCDPDGVQAELLEQMPFLSKRAPFSRFHDYAQPPDRSVRAMGGVRPIDSSSVGRWREHLPRVAGQIHKYGPISESLVRYGYEKDDKWEALLKGVEPDLTPSYHRRPRKREKTASRSHKRRHFGMAWLLLGQFRAARVILAPVNRVVASAAAGMKAAIRWLLRSPIGRLFGRHGRT